MNSRDDPFSRSRRNRPLNELGLKIFAGNASKELAEEIADHLGTQISSSDIGQFADGETYVRVNETVRGKDCYIIQSTSPPANDHLMELFLMISTLKRASAKSITAVIPYYGYARQDRKTEDRVSIGAADVATLLETMGVDSVVAVDLHCWQIEGFFKKIPVINLEASIIGMEYMLEDMEIENLDDLVVVSPDAGGVGRAKRFQGHLLRRGFSGVNLAVIVKQRSQPGVVARMDLIGSVEGKDCIIVDDMIDSAGTLCKAAQELKDFGAKKVYAFATHGVFTGKAPERIKNSALEKVIVTNTIPLSKEFKEIVPKEKYEHLSIGTFIAETIRRIYLK